MKRYIKSNQLDIEEDADRITIGSFEQLNYDDPESWEMLEHKSVPDSDGFYTDYTLYAAKDGSLFICMFGDRDLYEPSLSYSDFDTESIDEAYEWFEDYTGFDDDADEYDNPWGYDL